MVAMTQFNKGLFGFQFKGAEKAQPTMDASRAVLLA